METSFRENSVNVKTSFTTQADVLMHSNEVMQVLLNLLKNSEDNFLEKKTLSPLLSISTHLLENRVKIEVSDNGGGIEESVLDKIFDPYFSTKDEKNGTGLGLYMSKAIIEEHHKGILSVSNNEDGACFLIEIKIQEENSVND